MPKAAEAFRTISEVADDLEVPKHVLRFWEVKFPQIRPMKRGGGRRYYRPEDLELLRGIRHLLHAEGYTIKGVQKILREQGIDQVKEHGTPTRASAAAPVAAAAPEKPSARKRRQAAEAPSPAPAAARGRGAAPPARGRAAAPERPRAEQLAVIIAELEACRALLLGATPAASVQAAAPRARASR